MNKACMSCPSGNITRLNKSATLAIVNQWELNMSAETASLIVFGIFIWGVIGLLNKRRKR